MPVGFTRMRGFEVSSVSWPSSVNTASITCCLISGASWLSSSMPSACWVDSTTVSRRTGVVPSYWTVTWVLPSGRR